MTLETVIVTVLAMNPALVTMPVSTVAPITSCVVVVVVDREEEKPHALVELCMWRKEQAQLLYNESTGHTATDEVPAASTRAGVAEDERASFSKI